MSDKWHEIADKLATAMEHSEKGVCTLTDAEHAALAVYMETRRVERAWVRSYWGFAGKLDAFIHPRAHFRGRG